jgi:hypothetical protein
MSLNRKIQSFPHRRHVGEAVRIGHSPLEHIRPCAISQPREYSNPSSEQPPLIK